MIDLRFIYTTCNYMHVHVDERCMPLHMHVHVDERCMPLHMQPCILDSCIVLNEHNFTTPRSRHNNSLIMVT